MPDITPQQQKQQNKSMVIAVVVVMVLLAGLLLSMVFRGMGERATDNYVESQTGVDVDRNLDGSTTYTDEMGNEVTVTNDGPNSGTVNVLGTDGQAGTFSGSTGEGAKIPEGFPADFPQMTGATLVSAYAGTEGGGHSGFSVIWTVDGTVAEAEAFYRQELTAAGWTVGETSTFGGQAYVPFKKPSGDIDEDGGAVAISEADGRTTVSVTLGIHAR